MTEKELERINFLARKSRETSLSDEEKEEQKILRRKYIDSVVGFLKSQLDNTKVVHPDGRVESLKKDKNNFEN